MASAEYCVIRRADRRIANNLFILFPLEFTALQHFLLKYGKLNDKQSKKIPPFTTPCMENGGYLFYNYCIWKFYILSSFIKWIISFYSFVLASIIKEKYSRLIEMKNLIDFSGMRAVIGVGFHYVSHKIPPFFRCFVAAT